MNSRLEAVAEACLRGAESNTMTFPQIIGTLTQHGFESYCVDFRRGSATYYLPDGDSVTLPFHPGDTPIAPALDLDAVRAAIREAQQLVPGYTYAGFCKKVMAGGCAGYTVSIPGRRAVYFGRTAELHTEHFPP
jgi:uncharacterized protein YbcV (DUF1398 family)